MTTASGIQSGAGLSATTFTPTANQVFTITIGASPSNNPPVNYGNVIIMRSQDGTNFAPANVMITSTPGIYTQFPTPTSIDITEQRSGVVYAILFVSAPGQPVSYRFDQ